MKRILAFASLILALTIASVSHADGTEPQNTTTPPAASTPTPPVFHPTGGPRPCPECA